MYTTGPKSSGEYSRGRDKRRLVALLICWLVFQPGISLNPVKLGQVSLADIVPLPPGADVTIAGPSPRSRLGGSGRADNLSDSNHSQTLAVGDFNADGIIDLAISVSDAELIAGSMARQAGVVYVIFGRSDFLSVIDTAEAKPGGADLTIFGDGVSIDDSGKAFESFSRAPKIKDGGRKLKTRGVIDRKSLDQFFPDGAVRVLKLSALPCAKRIVSVRRQGNALVPTPAH